ncbi:anti-sigma factor family protein [Methylobacterium nodulans]|uniref:Putative transmembrane anti-sigma factor n=1 Tax=Methylobacterium nodulans (strain LMG 21967 / CNCM I-2342 / ORS 2060) TaxID=460265 RepID=B8IFH1_METNO|nr:anti-sigma factor [Methylobacterium nodulans]ACL57706.1 putative transmembrane anti-sigma factor [Methylobacterium nodulans ORS 2060]
MTRRDRPVGEDDLQAWIDGRLDPERQEAVQAMLADRPDLAQRLAAYQATQAALRARLQFKAEEPIPARLRVGGIAAAQRDTRKSRMLAAAVACLWLSLGGVIGWVANDLLGPNVPPGLGLRWAAMAREAIDAHRTFAVEVVHPVEVKASDQAHLAQWVAKRLGRSVLIPDLTPVGFHLVGGRILPAGQNIAAQFMFEEDKGTRLTVYVRTGEFGGGDVSFMRQGDVQTFYWVDDGCGYAVVGTFDRARLQTVAEQVFRQFEGPLRKNG